MKLKFIFTVLFLSFALLACNSGNNDEKELQQKVIDIHDKVMPKGGLIMNNKMRLDTLLTQLDSLKMINPKLDTVAEKQNIKTMIDQLEDADNAMSDWMSQFSLDYSGKKHEEVMQYLNSEKQKVEAIDKQFSTILDESSLYLSNFKNK